MMRKIILTTCLLFLSIVIFSQNEVEEKKNAIIFSPLNLIDPVNPAFQLGYQRQFDNKWEIQGEVGLLMTKSPWNYIFEDDFELRNTNNKGFKLRVELKRYLKEYGRIKNYVSLELFYLKNNTRTTDFFISNDDDSRYRDFFLNKKKKYGLNIKYGVRIIMSKRFFFDLYGGVGVSFREIRHENRDNLNDEFDFLPFWDKNKIIGNKWVINIPLNGKVGYQF